MLVGLGLCTEQILHKTPQRQVSIIYLQFSRWSTRRSSSICQTRATFACIGDSTCVSGEVRFPLCCCCVCPFTFDPTQINEEHKQTQPRGKERKAFESVVAGDPGAMEKAPVNGPDATKPGPACDPTPEDSPRQGSWRSSFQALVRGYIDK